jgi:ring-1,2-phenylacetyl-CoA epoxidase subunit PaaC
VAKGEFYNTQLVEQPNGDYAKTIARQYFVDVFDFHFYTALANSKDETLAGIAAKSIKEINLPCSSLRFLDVTFWRWNRRK